MSKLKPRERDAIVQALRAGVVPKLGLRHIQVGRVREIEELVKDMDRIADGGAAIRFIIGEYGSGKTFFMNLIRLIALEKGMVVMFADLAPDRRTLRQRLGRSGRRAGQPAVLRQYAVETRLTPESDYIDRLRLGLVRSVAMIDLLLEGWCEPPRPQALHLSTLVHQILSLIAERGGASAGRLFRVLCQEGPFKKVDRPILTDVLRALGQPETGLIEQSDDGLLLLGQVGEKLVEHYSFYAVFQSPEEYRLISGGKELGTLPIANVMAPGMMLIFSGRRWVIHEIDDRDKVIMVNPSKGGTPPIFGGDPGDIHDRVIERMFKVLEEDAIPAYMDLTARDLLKEARRHYVQLGFKTASVVSLSETRFALATRAGTVKTNTLALALRACGFTVETFDGFLTVTSKEKEQSLLAALQRIASGATINLFGDQTNLIFEKFHSYLTRDLLELDALSAKVDAAALCALCGKLGEPKTVSPATDEDQQDCLSD